MEEEKYPDHRAAFQLPRNRSRGFSFEGREMFTLTEEFGSPACHCPREQLRAAMSGKDKIATTPPAGSLQLCAAVAAQPDVMWRSQGSGTGTQPRVIGNAAASVTQGVSCRNCGFLTVEASTSPPREG